MTERAQVLNRLAAAIEREMGDTVSPDSTEAPWLPLSVRHAAAEAAVAVVEAWQQGGALSPSAGSTRTPEQ